MPKRYGWMVLGGMLASLLGGAPASARDQWIEARVTTTGELYSRRETPRLQGKASRSRTCYLRYDARSLMAPAGVSFVSFCKGKERFSWEAVAFDLIVLEAEKKGHALALSGLGGDSIEFRSKGELISLFGTLAIRVKRQKDEVVGAWIQSRDTYGFAETDGNTMIIGKGKVRGWPIKQKNLPRSLVESASQ